MWIAMSKYEIVQRGKNWVVKERGWFGKVVYVGDTQSECEAWLEMTPNEWLHKQ